jgi:hypothetical protein
VLAARALDLIFWEMDLQSPNEPVEPRQAPGASTGRDEPPDEFQPESGALAPCDPIDEAELERDPRDDL